MEYLKLFGLIFKILKWLQIAWVLIKLLNRIHAVFKDHDPVSSKTRTNILKQAMDAVDESDILKLTNSLQLFDSMSKRK